MLSDLISNLSEAVGHPLFSIGSTKVTSIRLLAIVAVFVGAWWLAALLEAGLRRLAVRRQEIFGESSYYVLSRLARYTVWIVVTLVGLSMVGIDITALAVFGGAVGIGIGLGLRDLFNNLVAGIILLLERSLKIGDYIEIATGVTGTVREISMRYTRVTTNDGVDVLVPNSLFVTQQVTNWTLDDRFRRVHIPFTVAYGSDKEQVRKAGLAAARKVEYTQEDDIHPMEVWLTGFGDSALNFELVVWLGPDSVQRPGAVQAAYLWAIEDELRAHSIEIPFPQRDLHLRGGAVNVRLEKD